MLCPGMASLLPWSIDHLDVSTLKILPMSAVVGGALPGFRSGKTSEDVQANDDSFHHELHKGLSIDINVEYVEDASRVAESGADAVDHSDEEERDCDQACPSQIPLVWKNCTDAHDC